MNKTLFSSLALLGLLLLLTPRPALADRINTNSPAPAVVDMEDSPDLEDEDDGCAPPAANDGPNGDGSPCEKNSAPGMAVWRVSSAFLNLWLDDTPLRYRLADGKWMELTLSYKQRGETREDFLDAFGPGWSCNWMGLAVRSNTGSIFLHKAGGGREIMITNQHSPRTLGEPVCCMAPCGWQSGVRINSPGGSSRTYTNTVCSPYPDSATYLLRSFCADRYGRGTTYRWAGFTTNSTCYARLNTIDDRDGNTCTLSYTNFADGDGHLLQRVSAVTDPYSRTARFFYDHNGRLTNITDTIGLVSSFKYDQAGVITNLHTDYGDTGFRHFETNNGSGSPLGRAIEISEPNGTKQLYVYRSELPQAAVGTYATHDSWTPLQRNSFHWDRAQYAALSSQALTNYLEMPDEDFLKASLQHWLLANASGAGTLSDTLAAQAGPLVETLSGPARANQVCYWYQGQTAQHTVGTAKRITQINWNGIYFSQGTSQQLDIGRNTWGRPTNITFYSGTAAYTYTNYFDTDGRILQRVMGPRGEEVRGYGYHPVYTNLLTSVTNGTNQVVRYTHDTNSLKMKLTSVSYPGGLVTTNFYNGAGFLERTIDIGVRTNSFAYQNGNLWYQTNELGLVTTNTWDNLGRLLSTHYPDGTYTSNWFDKLDVVGARDRMGSWTRYAFNQVRQRAFVTNANGQVTQYIYCDCGSPSEIIAWNGSTPVTTRFYHDIAGRMTNVVYPDNYSVTNTFDALSRLERITDSASRQASLSYNDYNQLIQVLVGQSGTQLTWLARQFDEYGRLTNSVDRNGVITTNSFDDLGRMVDRRTIGGDLLVQSGLETFVYNERGLTNYTDPLGKITRFVRDAEGQVLSQTNANQEVLQFTYNPAGDIMRLTDGKDQVTKWNYSQYGQVTNKVDHNDAEMFRYQYDPNGRLTNRWQAGNITTTYRFDPIGNLTNVVYPNSGSIVLAYDYANRLTNMVDRVGTSGFSWTAAGQLAGEDGPWDNDAVSYGYTHRLRTSLGLAQPNASAWSQGYGHDDYWRLQTLTSPAGTFTTHYEQRSAAGLTYAVASDLVAQLDNPAGGYTYDTHDGLGRLLSTTLYGNAGALNSHAYEYNSGHQRTKQTFTKGNYVDYTYDEIGQLKTAKGKESDNAVRPHEQFGYAYDKAWNLNYRTNNALTQTFGVNNLNELTTLSRDGTMTVAGAVSATPTSVTVKDNANSAQTADVFGDNTFARTNVTLLNGNNTFTAVAEDSYNRSDTNTVISYLPSSSSCFYDARGNLTNDGRRVFYYDDENQLTTVLVSNAWKSEFIYDGLMRRRVRKEYTWSASAWLQTNEVRYIYDGRLVLQERFYAPIGSTVIPQNTVTYTRGNDLSGTLQGAGGIGGLLARSDTALPAPGSGLHAYYHADGNGNITALVDTNQVLVAQYHFDPYGNILSMAGPLAEANLYRFSSKEIHPNSGLVYYLYRYYEPSMLRWINRDPIQEYGGLNLSIFCENAPYSCLDSMGLDLLPKWVREAGHQLNCALGNILGGLGQYFGAIKETDASGRVYYEYNPLVFAGSAITLGNVINFQGSRDQSIRQEGQTIPLSAHEEAHIPQSEEMGPLYLPTYFLMLLWVDPIHNPEWHEMHPMEIGPNSCPPQPWP